MTRRKKILIGIAAGIPALFLILIAASIIVIQTSWFQNYVKDKIVSSVEDSTGGVVDIGSFVFDPWTLTARIRNFVLHGTEPKNAAPLASASLLEARVKLFSGLYHLVDLRYLGLDTPKVNLIVFPDGKTNIPQPKIQQKPSQTSGLETVLDLKIGQFEIKNGLLQYAQHTTPFSGRGENLRALLDYNIANTSYQGNLRIDPLLLAYGPAGNPPLNVHVNLPVVLQKDAVFLNSATLNTAQSQILVTASMQNMNAPQISAKLNATISLPEMQKSLDLPIDPQAKGAPGSLNAELTANYDDKSGAIQVQTAHVAIGGTVLQASGSLDPSKNSAVQFNANLALNELSRLMKVTSVQASGDLQANGTATMNAQKNYAINGTLNSRGLNIRQGTTRLSDVSLYTPFHADPYLISLDGLRLSLLGGNLNAKVFIEKMQQLTVEGTLHNFSLSALANAFTGKHLGYDGMIDGALRGNGNLKAKGTTGYRAEARLAIAPGRRGVPVSGRIDADYVGASGAIDLGHSYITMPHSRIDLAGSLNRQVNVNLISRNLNDFLPAANFGAKTPTTSLPISLQNDGVATIQAQITGNLSAPHIAGHVAVNHFSAGQRPFDQLAADLNASPAAAVIQNGSLTAPGLQTAFDASIGLHDWTPLPRSPLAANATVRSNNVADLLSLAGESSVHASGNLAADAHVNGTYGDPLGSASLELTNASYDGQPIDRLSARVALQDQLITLSTLQLAAAGGQINVNGTYQHPRDSFLVGHAQFHIASSGVQLANIRPLQNASPGVAGVIQLNADSAADIREVKKQTEVTIANVSADFSARALRVQNQSAGDLTATARTVNGNVQYNVNSDFAGSNIRINGSTALLNGFYTSADASIQNLNVQKALLIAGQSSIPASGNLTANAHVVGRMEAPNANLSFALSSAKVYQEPINRLQGSLQYSNTLVSIPGITLDVPAGTVTVQGSLSHKANDYKAGALQVKVNSTDIQLGKIVHVEQEQPGLAGTLHLAADLSAQLQPAPANGLPVRISHLNAAITTNRLRMNNRALGELTLDARTAGSNLNFRLDSDIAKSQIHAAGQTQLAGTYNTNANLTFTNIRYANIVPFVATDPTVKSGFDAAVDGQASLNGPLMDTNLLNARLQLSKLDLTTVPQTSPTGAPARRPLEIRNQGPLVVALNHSVLNVEHFQLTGPGTNISASGSVNLKNGSSPLGLSLNGGVDLSLLQDVSHEFYSSGTVSLNALIRGNFTQPLVNGRVELKNANVEYVESPNGISNANAVILLNGTSANIQTFTAESGGGKVTLSGFAAYTGTNANFNLKAKAQMVRVRYSGVSATSNADISIIGNTTRSLITGNVTAERIVYGSSADTGTLLSFASAPPSTPSAPNPLLANTRLSIHVRTAPDLRVVTTYANRLNIFADLTVRGTAAEPGMVGRVTVTDGQLVFFGNTYTVNVGNVNFYNTNAIEPVLNLSLETIAQNVDVTLGVNGPIDDLHLTYSSDPPLTFQQIVQLLATNTTPANPIIAAQQPTPPQQSTTQMGESALLGQAVANPLASRVQRVFGISQFKIDPSFSGSNGQPSARVTLQQKIANNITFTYITDVTQTNDEIIRVEFAINPKLSAVALRDFNGNVSLEFFYKFKKR
ncbi:MAG TPA: translocation/assembly module TamB domain-containing protein [Bryobacteraceae bacterium]|nr:translocation/assembly module TamB domain-containing protein [Bryobacteraceae bacterium]